MDTTPSPSGRKTRSAKLRRSAPVGREVNNEPVGARIRVTAVMERARECGLILGKSSRISGRVSPELIASAKANTGITSDTELVEYALANIALEDRFLEVFHQIRGTVDPDLDLEF